MTLFEECKELLKTDFYVMKGDDLSAVMDIFINIHGIAVISNGRKWTLAIMNLVMRCLT
ncbi:hypothetical protein [Enterobacter quasimori]|uniref:hypothetical protein n=1 Tax=Enterobacter quasimori TaxID=2838947 RepID=UPI001F3003A4|nr:hypothetical protein [Enterobacter quasimori]